MLMVTESSQYAVLVEIVDEEEKVETTLMNAEMKHYNLEHHM